MSALWVIGKEITLTLAQKCPKLAATPGGPQNAGVRQLVSRIRPGSTCAFASGPRRRMTANSRGTRDCTSWTPTP